ncbi:hypothetical protein GWL_31200 [Herbaspirillum sp. GW103]|uniref:hypothetical protein n=1 Tax=Herbaspirillum sp. GW103 TaxID=1175306 RepID=UPI00025E3BC0|nr:hypothetical protein [Herbaspirillum sp. GW103]EIJ46092.1 hypothetical protein GWL_31200 [Herbaspirillum sp. GW103]
MKVTPAAIPQIVPGQARLARHAFPPDPDRPSPVPAAQQTQDSVVVSLSDQGRRQWAEEMQQALASPLEGAVSQAQLRKRMEKLLKRTALLEMDVFSELREKVKAQLQQKTPLPPAQRQAKEKAPFPSQATALCFTSPAAGTPQDLA